MVIIRHIRQKAGVFLESNNIELITRMVIQAINQNEKKGDGFMVPIGVSARHIHLT